MLPPPAPNKVCAAAGDLVRQGQPQRALRLIGQARRNVPAARAHRRCASQYAGALLRRGRAQALVAWFEILRRYEPDDSISDVNQAPPRSCRSSRQPINPEINVERGIEVALVLALHCDRVNARALALRGAPPADGKNRVCASANRLTQRGEPQRALTRSPRPALLYRAIASSEGAHANTLPPCDASAKRRSWSLGSRRCKGKSPAPPWLTWNRLLRRPAHLPPELLPPT